MGTRQPIGTIAFPLLVALLVVGVCDVAGAQTRWPPWQSYGDAEKATRAEQKRHAVPKQSEIDALNARVATLRQAGKTDEAIAVAKRALSLTQQRHGRDNVATAQALTTLAELLIDKTSYAEAEPLLKRALAIREKSKDSKQIALALDNLAKLYEKQGRKADAKQLKDREVRVSQGQGAERASDASKPECKKFLPAVGKTVTVPCEQPEIAKRKEAEGLSAEAKQAAELEQRRQEALKRLRDDTERLAAVKKASPPAASAPPVASAPPAASAPVPSSEDSPFGGLGDGVAKPRARAYRRAPDATTAEPGIMDEKSGGGAAAPKKMEAPDDGEAATEAARAPAPTAASRPSPPPAAAGPEGGLSAQQEKWDVVPVFFGTDRSEEANPKRLSYGSDRGRRLQLGRALVTVPKLHEVPQVERPWALRIPYFNVTIYEEAEDPNKHFTMQEIKKLSKDDLLKLVRQRLAGSSRFKDQALVFVHGYNTAFDNAIYRTAQIAYDLKFDGAPFLYSWPSGGAVASYTYDRESAEASKPYMRQFLEMVVKETGAKSVSIIAHSMGNQPLMDVLKDMKSSAPEGVAIGQVILAAPDVDADSFSNLAQAINGMAKGVTLYAASNDRALIVSRNFWGHARAGDVPAGGPLVLPGIDSIDVTAASTDAFAINHSGYAQNNSLLTDIGELIETGKRPPEDRGLKPERITTERGTYWRYAAHPPTP